MSPGRVVALLAMGLCLAGLAVQFAVLPVWVYVLALAPVLEEAIKYKLPELRPRFALLLLAVLVLGEAVAYGYQLHAHGATALQILAIRGPAVVLHLLTAGGHWAAWYMAQQTTPRTGLVWRLSFFALAVAGHAGWNRYADGLIGGWLS